MARSTHRLELVFVEEIEVAAQMAEIEPIWPRRLGRQALLQEGAERRDAGAGTDHDDRLAGVSRQREMLRRLHVDPDLVARIDAPGEESRRDAEPRAAVDR